MRLFVLFLFFPLFLFTQSLQEAKRLNELQNYEAALVQINGFLQNNPQNASALSLRGSLYHQLDRLKEALADFEKASQLYTEKTEKDALMEVLAQLNEALFNRCETDCEGYKNAYINYLKLQYEAFPEDIFPLRQLAEFEAQYGNPVNALSLFNLLIKEDKSDAIYYTYLKRAALLANYNRILEALADCNTAETLYANGVDAYLVRWIIKEEKGGNSDADFAFLESKLSLAQIYRFKAFTQYTFFHNKAGACSALKEAIALNDDEAMLYTKTFCE